eukprot:760660-Hanusia_phi.AAC.2
MVSHYARASIKDKQPVCHPNVMVVRCQREWQETWMRQLQLDVLIFEGVRDSLSTEERLVLTRLQILARKLDFDYAPESTTWTTRRHGGGGQMCASVYEHVRDCCLARNGFCAHTFHRSQEGRSAINDLTEQGFLNTLRAPSAHLLSTIVSALRKFQDR